jgi:hypothetical protein
MAASLRRRLFYFLVAIAAFFVAVAPALGQTAVTLTNPSFETPVVANGATVNPGGVSGWVFSSPVQFYKAATCNTFYPSTTTNGSQCVYFGGSNQATQTLSNTYQSGQTYTFTMRAGWISSRSATLALLRSGGLVAQSKNVNIPSGGGDYSITYTVPAVVVGQPIGIRFSTSQDMGIDFARLTISPNQAPTALNLSNTNLNPAAAPGSAVGNLSATDPNPDTSFTYSLVAGAGSTDNAAFSIVGSQLRINATPTKSSYSIRVRAADPGGLFFDRVFTLTVPDTERPTAALSAANVTASASSYQFSVTYSDNVAIAVTSFSSSNIEVTGPNGFAEFAVYDSANSYDNGTPRTVYYSITPPGGSWTSAANGTYTITLLANQIYDTSNNSALSASGTFTVNVPGAEPPPSDTYSQERCSRADYRSRSEVRNPELFRDRENRLYLLGMACGDRVTVTYYDLPHRVRIRPNACGLLQFWRSVRFNPFLNNRLTIYLSPPYDHATLDIIPSAIASAPADSDPCPNGIVNNSLPWQTIAPGVRAVRIQRDAFSRGRLNDTLYVDGLAGRAALQDGNFLQATNYDPHRRFAWVNRCGMARYTNNRQFNNLRHRPGMWRYGTDETFSFDFEDLPVRPAPVCRNGQLFNAETRQPWTN